MSRKLRLKRGTTAQNAAYLGAEGEVTYDTQAKSLVIHDGVTTGGIPVGGGPVAQVDATVGGTVVIDAGTTSLDFTGAYSSTKTIDCVNIADGATVAIHSINDIGTVTLSGTGLIFTGSLTPFIAGQVGTLTRNGNVVHAAEPESVLNKVQEIESVADFFASRFQYPSLLATTTAVNTRLAVGDVFDQFILSGLDLTMTGGLNTTLSAGVAYIGGEDNLAGSFIPVGRIVRPTDNLRTHLTFRDTYVDLTNLGYGLSQLNYVTTDNGNPPPTQALASLRLWKIVTNGTDVTSIERLAPTQPTFKTPVTVPDAVVAGDAANKGQLDAASVQCIPIACSDETTALTAGTGKVTFRMPYAFTLQKVRASLSTAQTSGSIFTVDVNEGGVSVFSTTLTIDNTEKTSTTATTPAVISDTALADDAEITIDIDQIGDGTAKGLKVLC